MTALEGDDYRDATDRPPPAGPCAVLFPDGSMSAWMSHDRAHAHARDLIRRYGRWWLRTWGPIAVVRVVRVKDRPAP
jgi:hypothetical protein